MITTDILNQPASVTIPKEESRGGAFPLHSYQPLARPVPDLAFVRAQVSSAVHTELDAIAAITGLTVPQLAEFLVAGPQPFRRLYEIVEARLEALAQRTEELTSAGEIGIVANEEDIC